MNYKMVSLFILAGGLCSIVFSAACADYACDTLIVRGILDSNGFSGTPVDSVADSGLGRIVRLNLAGRYSINHNLAVNEKEIVNINKLRYLNLSLNRLENLPMGIWDLAELDTLILWENILADRIPDDIRKLVHLKYLDLTNCWIVALPDGLWDLANLEYLYLVHMWLPDYMLPDGIGRLRKLKMISLYQSYLVRLPDTIMILPELSTVDVTGNWLCDSVSRELGEWLDVRDPDWRQSQVWPGTNAFCWPQARAVPYPLECSRTPIAAETVRMQVYDLQGRPVRSGSSPAAGMPTRIYIVKEPGKTARVVIGRGW
jgi:hypothetical protein